MATDWLSAPGGRRPFGRRPFWLPAWRSVYPGRTDVTPGREVIGWALPFALVAAVFAVLSLANAGPARWVWRQASLGMLVSNVLASAA
ncbi:hypothetical protein ACLQ29_18545 [Micromonospora sp. DT228]|uniref:hypothetical protein n=1 Tax=Micromonospora sp. DT228 TaxID=3393443 RepID=UPI003CF281C9